VVTLARNFSIPDSKISTFAGTRSTSGAPSTFAGTRSTVAGTRSTSGTKPTPAQGPASSKVISFENVFFF
jgi:hypothetical protein